MILLGKNEENEEAQQVKSKLKEQGPLQNWDEICY